ncbi:GDSL-type esterase/lipase family protein [Phytomonospora endophytica]|uniref:Lysophospholipase L1-like esterase n=1 Tax=Phytomonospora endophytica TaxID=714109 RepID=A0A841FIB6_9ACTN|nr:GDSL-type esterase/lipase family protein [Phytomonospora endophytica]MBB6035495.1 lysophospholipase L1-like esterase [Phytomonospora endophytica]GIG63752.1 hypothetical protein Pen01_00470 [Phytomonospora endophytica]
MPTKTLKIGLAAVIVLGVVVGAVAHGTESPPSPSPPPPSAEQAFTPIMPLGDSMTLGIQATGGMPRFVAYDGYREDLWLRLRDDAGIKPDFVGSCPRDTWDRFKCSKGRGTMDDPDHEGHSGFRVHQLSAFIDGWIDEAQPKIVLLMVGTNDLCDACDREHAPGRLADLVGEIMARLPADGRLFVATIPRRHDVRGAYVDAYNAEVPGVVDAAEAAHPGRVHLVPQHVVGEEAGDMSPDGVHPSACGYAKLAFVWYRAMDERMPGDWDLGESPFEGHGACA